MAQQDEEPPQNHQYPLDHSSYKIHAMIGAGVSAFVFKAECLSNSSVVAIKAIDLDRSKDNLDEIRREAKTMSLLSHPNILRAHCSFTVHHHVWVVMPFMSGGSLQSINLIIHGAELGLRTISPQKYCMMTINGITRELERVKKRISILEQQLERLTIIFPSSSSSNNNNNGRNDDDESNANPSQ